MTTPLRDRLAEIMADAWPLTDMPPWEGATEPERDVWREVADALLASEEWQAREAVVEALAKLLQEYRDAPFDVVQRAHAVLYRASLHSDGCQQSGCTCGAAAAQTRVRIEWPESLVAAERGLERMEGRERVAGQAKVFQQQKRFEAEARVLILTELIEELRETMGTLYRATLAYLAAHDGYEKYPDMLAALVETETVLGLGPITR